MSKNAHCVKLVMNINLSGDYMRKFLLVMALGIFVSGRAFGQDVDTIFKKVNELKTAGKYQQALIEIGWAVKELERMHIEKLRTFMPATIEGFGPAQTDSTSVIGMINLQRTFSRESDNAQLMVSMSGSVGNNPATSGFGQLGAMNQATGNPGQETFHVEGNVATLVADKVANTSEVTVFIGSMVLKINLGGSADKEFLRKALNSMKIRELTEYLKN